MGIKKVRIYWEKFIAGDKDAFGRVYEICNPILTFYCLGILKDIEQAENCASEALIKAYEISEPEKIIAIDKWLFTVAKNHCISHLRQTKRHQESLQSLGKSGNDQQEPSVVREFDQKNIDKLIINNLDPSDYKIWKLHSDGFDNEEIAKELDMNKKTVANRKSAIRSKLKTLIKSI